MQYLKCNYMPNYMPFTCSLELITSRAGLSCTTFAVHNLLHALRLWVFGVRHPRNPERSLVSLGPLWFVHSGLTLGFSRWAQIHASNIGMTVCHRMEEFVCRSKSMELEVEDTQRQNKTSFVPSSIVHSMHVLEP